MSKDNTLEFKVRPEDFDRAYLKFNITIFGKDDQKTPQFAPNAMCNLFKSVNVKFNGTTILDLKNNKRKQDELN